MSSLLTQVKFCLYNFSFFFINSALKISGKKEVCFIVKHKLMFHYVRPIFEQLKKDTRLRCWICIPSYHSMSKADMNELKNSHDVKYINEKLAKRLLFDLIIFPDHTVRFHKKCKKIRIEHGFFNGKLNNGENYMLGSGALDEDGDCLYNKILVSSEYICNGIKRNYPKFSEQVRAVGNLLVDEILPYSEQKNEIFSSIGLDLKRKTIMVTSTWNSESFIQSQGESFISQIPALVEKYNLIISIHPHNLIPEHSGGKDWYTMLKNVKGSNVYLVEPGSESFHLLANSDLLITDTTSLGLYFPIFLRPIIHFDDPRLRYEPLSLNTELQKCAYQIMDANNIENKITAAFSEFDKQKMANLTEKIVSYRGNSWSRFSTEIYESLNLLVHQQYTEN